MSHRGARRVPKELSRQRQLEAWALRQKCWTYKRIGDHLGIDESSVRASLQRYEVELVECNKVEANYIKECHRQQLEYLAEQAMLGWERSLKDAETYKEVEDGEGSRIERTRRGQSGNAAHLANVRAALQEIRNIYGVDAAPKAAVPEQDNEPVPEDGPKDEATGQKIDV